MDAMPNNYPAACVSRSQKKDAAQKCGRGIRFPGQRRDDDDDERGKGREGFDRYARQGLAPLRLAFETLCKFVEDGLQVRNGLADETGKQAGVFLRHAEDGVGGVAGCELEHSRAAKQSERHAAQPNHAARRGEFSHPDRERAARTALHADGDALSERYFSGDAIHCGIPVWPA
jgi:hypothetical protein